MMSFGAEVQGVDVRKLELLKASLVRRYGSNSSEDAQRGYQSAYEAFVANLTGMPEAQIFYDVVIQYFQREFPNADKARYKDVFSVCTDIILKKIYPAYGSELTAPFGERGIEPRAPLVTAADILPSVTVRDDDIDFDWLLESVGKAAYAYYLTPTNQTAKRCYLMAYQKLAEQAGKKLEKRTLQTAEDFYGSVLVVWRNIRIGDDSSPDVVFQQVFANTFYVDVMAKDPPHHVGEMASEDTSGAQEQPPSARKAPGHQSSTYGARNNHQFSISMMCIGGVFTVAALIALGLTFCPQILSTENAVQLVSTMGVASGVVGLGVFAVGAIVRLCSPAAVSFESSP